MGLPVLTVAPAIQVLGYIPTAAPSPIGLGIGAAAGAVAIARLGLAAVDLVNANNDLSKAKETLLETEERLSRARAANSSTGDKAGDPPFIGGQSAVLYEVFWRIRDNSNGNTVPGNVVGLTGPILGIRKIPIEGSNQVRNYIVARGGDGLFDIGNTAPPIEYYIDRVARVDGQSDAGANPASDAPPTPSGYKGPNGDRLEDRQKRKLSPSPPPLAKPPNSSPNSSPTNSPNSSPTNSPTNSPLGSASRPPQSLVPPVPAGTPTISPTPRTNPPPTPNIQEPPPPFKKDDKKAPPPTPFDNNQDISQKLTGLAAIIALISTNTQPDAQRTNAKNGSCDALNSPSCTENLKNDIKEPILDKVNQNSGAISGLGAALSGINTFLTNSIFPKLEAIQSFSEKVARAARLDKVYNLLTFLTVIHNASMLSSSISTTLMDALSLGLATAGIKDENESPIDIQSVINSTVENKVKSIIGVENYTVLSDRWKKAVRVYQAAANITYQVRSLWDSAKSLAELTGANVGKIGNALRRDGVVAENAYTAMADNPLMVNNAMTKLQNLEEAASHLNAITSEAYSVTETVTQIKKDQDDFKKLAKESLPLAPITNDAAKAKDDAAKLVSVSPNIANTDLVKPD